MSCEFAAKNGLLLLLQAAKEIDREPTLLNYSEESTTRNHPPRNLYSRIHSPPTSYSCSVQRREAPSTRCTHNELEKSRRSHLRNCIEELKEHLVFDNDVPRITMLTVLRKATMTINMLRRKNEFLESCEAAEKLRCEALLKRRQSLRRKLESVHYRKKAPNLCPDRNRTFSECSFLTTSSDDSEMDLASRQLVSHKSNKSTLKIRQNTTFQVFSSTEKFGASELMCPLDSKMDSNPECAQNPQGCADIFDAYSSDSGFEEINVQPANEAQILTSVEYIGK